MTIDPAGLDRTAIRQAEGLAGRSSLRESDIRPPHLQAEQAERFAADIRRLLTHKDEFVAVACPACRSTEDAKSFEKCDLTYLTCRECGTLYMSPRPSRAVLKLYYETSENYRYWNKYIFPATEEVRRVKLFRPRADRVAEICARHGINDGVLLEVGAGYGTFCEEVLRLRAFRRVIAVEPTPDLAATCREKGLDVIEKPIEEAQLADGTIDVVASFEVIEHLFCPADFLKSVRSVLAPGGLLVISCPNGNGFDVATLLALSKTVDVEHLNYFNPGSLSLLMEACDFQVVEVFTPGKLDAELVREKILSGEFDVSGQSFLRTVLVDRWDELGGPFQQFLAENGLSSHMWLVARKA